MLRPRAFRADLWRYLIMWDQGGIYTDAKFYFSKDLDWINWDDDELILCGDYEENFNRYINGFMVSAQYHPAPLVAAMAAVKNI